MLERHADRLDLELVERALRFSASAHRGQKRMSGEDFVSHTIAVALILAEQLLDSTTIVAALLHDVVEDSDVRMEDIAREFGPEVAGIVDGLTKISSLTFHSSAEEQVENYRKLLLSIAKDARVIIIKLGDRLHNMRTLEHLPPERRARIALETREIYAPAGPPLRHGRHQGGAGGPGVQVPGAGRIPRPRQQVAAKRAAREQTILKLKTPLDIELQEAGIDWFEVTGRPKHLWSIFQKMKKRAKAFDEIYDLMAVRVIVRSVPDCYHVLGIIHHNWTPIQERIKDYIASPKSNAYQSLHTTIFGPGGQLFEVQIRTQDMHRTAEYGIAAHWVYKRDGTPDELDQHLGWFRQLLELQQDTHSPEEFLEFLKIDLYQDEIFIFTPQGDVKRLPKGSTAIDFAFHVHTEVGLKCQGAKVNGRIAPLHRELKSGDTVEILTSASAKPSRDWLSHVRTARARQKIKQWVNHEEETVSRSLGKEILAREVRRRRLDPPDDTPPGQGRRVPLAGRRRRARDRGGPGRCPHRAGHAGALSRSARATSCRSPSPRSSGGSSTGSGWGGASRSRAWTGSWSATPSAASRCPGDSVVGYVTQGRGISIHRSDCPNLLTLAADGRRVDIDWQETAGEAFAVRLAVTGEDRRGLYADIMEAISQTGTNIRGADLHTKDGSVFGTIFVEVDNLPHLGKVMKAVRRVKGVTEIERREAPAN